MESTRIDKVNRLLQKELGEIFRQETAKTRGTLVSVTSVRTSSDLSYCNVRISIFPSAKAQEILASINKTSGEIRYKLGQKVRYQLRIIPELRFFLDDSLDYLEHIDELLKK